MRRLKRYSKTVIVIGAAWKAIDLLSGADWVVENAPGVARALSKVSFPSASTTVFILGVLLLGGAIVLDRRLPEGDFAPQSPWRVPRRQKKGAAEEQRSQLIALMRSFGEPAVTQATRILQDLTRRRREAGEGETATLIEHQAYDPALRTLSVANDVLTLPGSEGYYDADRAQALFGQMYRAYQGVSSWILKCFKQLGELPSDHALYHSWRDVDRRFIADIRLLAAQHGFETLRRETEGVGHGEGVRRDLANLATKEADQSPSKAERPSSVEIKYLGGRQDAIVMPHTDAVGARVPSLLDSEVRNQIASFIEQGHTLLDSLIAEAERGPPANVSKLPLWYRRMDEYVTDVEDWLERELERSYMMRFRNPPTASSDPKNPISQAAEYADLRQAWDGVRRRIDTLHEFLKEGQRK